MASALPLSYSPKSPPAGLEPATSSEGAEVFSLNYGGKIARQRSYLWLPFAGGLELL